MKCLKCGTELPAEAKFCVQCGMKVEGAGGEMKKETEKENSQAWHKLSILGKMAVIVMAISGILCFIAFACGKPMAGAIAITQLCLWLVAWLMKKETIKTQKEYVYIIIIGLAFGLFIPYFCVTFTSKEPVAHFPDSDTEAVETLSDLVWPNNELTDLLPVPKSTKGYVQWEYADEISIYVGEVTKEDYAAYIAECVEKGFSTVTSESSDFYNANNEKGYRLSLNYQEEQAMVITVKEPLYTVQIELSCVENLLFNKYDVAVYVDDTLVGTLEHGTADFFETQLEKGTYTVKVEKEDDELIDGTITIDVSESTKFAYSIQCQSNQIEITEEYVEILGTLADGQIKMPKSAEEYRSEIYVDVVEELKSAGFVNIKENVIYDLTGGWLDIDGDVEEISIDGRTDFKKAEIFDSNAEIIITYHTFEISSEEMWDKIIDKGGQNASDIVKSFENTGYTIICYVGGEVINDFSPEGYIFEDGWLETDEKIAHLNFTTEELQALIAQLEETFPQEKAKRAAVVALTNSQATDVFNDDGSTYNVSKFHSYSDISGFYLTVVEEGKWKAVDDHTWHVDNLKCMISGTGTYLKASLDVSLDETSYTVSNVDKVIAAKEYIDSEDTSKINAEHLEPTENTPYLTVAHSMVEEDRDIVAEEEQNNKTTPTDDRTSWIESQFSLWDGAHKELEKLIKNNLNDEKSYKHIETTYIDVVNEENQELVNDIISNMGYQVEIGDLFVITEFSAKNAFNATIKSTAYGIVSYSNNTVTLIGVE